MNTEMTSKMNWPLKRLCVGLCGLALLGLSACSPANAQGKMKRQKSDSMMPGAASSAMMDHRNDGDWDDDWYSDPAPLNYPMAAPGSLHLYHYHTYRENRIMEGSVEDTRMERQRMLEKHAMHGLSKDIYRDNPDMADPAPLNYPLAAPGTLDLYHYHTYRDNMIMEGSPTDQKARVERMRDNMRFGNDWGHMDWQMMSDPYPVNYPFAAPGSLNLYSFTDYTGDHLTEGAASDRKMDQQQMMDRQNRNSGKMKSK